MPTYPSDWQAAIRASFLGRLPEELRADLLTCARQQQAAPKTILYHESERPEDAHLVLVLDGLVRVFRTSRSGREVTVRHARLGDVLGLPSVVAEASRAAAQAVVATNYIAMSARRLRERAQHDSQLAWAIAEELAGSLFNIQERLAHNVFAPVRSRVARYLLDVAVLHDDGRVAVTSHEDIAAAIGSVREVVARTLTAFRNEGLTQRVDAGILLLDPDAVRQVAQTDEFPDFRIRR